MGLFGPSKREIEEEKGRPRISEDLLVRAMNGEYTGIEELDRIAAKNREIFEKYTPAEREEFKTKQIPKLIEEMLQSAGLTGPHEVLVVGSVVITYRLEIRFGKETLDTMLQGVITNEVAKEKLVEILTANPTIKLESLQHIQRALGIKIIDLQHPDPSPSSAAAPRKGFYT